MGLVFYNGINNDRNYHLSHICTCVCVCMRIYIYSKGVCIYVLGICIHKYNNYLPTIRVHIPNNNVDSLMTATLKNKNRHSCYVSYSSFVFTFIIYVFQKAYWKSRYSISENRSTSILM